MCTHAPGKFSISGNDSTMLKRPYLTDEIFTDDFPCVESLNSPVCKLIDASTVVSYNAAVLVCYHVITCRQGYPDYEFRLHFHRHNSLSLDSNLLCANVNDTSGSIVSASVYTYDDSKVSTDVVMPALPGDHPKCIDIHVYLPVPDIDKSVLVWPPESIVDGQDLLHNGFKSTSTIVAMPIDIKRVKLESITSKYNLMPMLSLSRNYELAFRVSYDNSPRISAVPAYYPIIGRYNWLIKKVSQTKNRDGYCRSCLLLTRFKEGDIHSIFK